VNIARLEARFGSRSPAAIVSFAPSAVPFVQPSYLVGLVELATKVAILAPLNASIKILLWGFKESLSGVRDRTGRCRRPRRRDTDDLGRRNPVRITDRRPEVGMIKLEWNADGDAVIKLTGNLNWVAVTALRHVVHDLLRLGVNFVIDLSSTSGVDATGASALVGTTRRARAIGPSVSIVNPRPSVRRGSRPAPPWLPLLRPPRWMLESGLADTSGATRL
jgi:anti-anti-sigma factor